MKRYLYLTNAFLLFTMLHSCSEQEVTNLQENSIIPKPRSVLASGESFSINKRTAVLFNSESKAVEDVAQYLSGSIEDIAGLQPETAYSLKTFKKGNIYLSVTDEKMPGEEWYRLEIAGKAVTVSAADAEGLFRGVVTLRQLMMLQGSDMNSSRKGIVLPTGVIEDFPEYEYRGTMLDVARHFFPPETVKQYIDILALYKINVLHLHLSDDQGWRIEIKSWPRLTEIGGSTQVGGGPGGFYTQEQYRDIVAYAATKHITIVPEIDMPGHTNAALASYAELNCDGKATELYTGMKVGFSTLCTRSEITYKFVDDVVREISEMSPGPYFHIGGDESHVTALPDYIYFVDRVKKIVHSHGKIMMGWDEISHAALTDGDVAQYWSSAENAKRAVGKGAKLIISPAKRCYLDMKYDSTTALGLNWAAYIEVDDAYNWNPVELEEGIGREQILGVESPLWSETIETLDDIEYLAFPRLIGHAEIGWSNADDLSWEDYSQRLSAHGRLLDGLGVDYYRSPLIKWKALGGQI